MPGAGFKRIELRLVRARKLAGGFLRVAAVAISGAVMIPDIAAADARRGEAFAARTCGSCHAVGRTGASPNPQAPTFVAVSRRYNPSDLEEALAEGIVTGHPGMPEFTLNPRQIDDLVAHLRQLRRRR